MKMVKRFYLYWIKPALSLEGIFSLAFLFVLMPLLICPFEFSICSDLHEKLIWVAFILFPVGVVTLPLLSRCDEAGRSLPLFAVPGYRRSVFKSGSAIIGLCIALMIAVALKLALYRFPLLARCLTELTSSELLKYFFAFASSITVLCLMSSQSRRMYVLLLASPLLFGLTITTLSETLKYILVPLINLYDFLNLPAVRLTFSTTFIFLTIFSIRIFSGRNWLRYSHAMVLKKSRTSNRPLIRNFFKAVTDLPSRLALFGRIFCKKKSSVSIEHALIETNFILFFSSTLLLIVGFTIALNAFLEIFSLLATAGSPPHPAPSSSTNDNSPSDLFFPLFLGNILYASLAAIGSHATSNILSRNQRGYFRTVSELLSLVVAGMAVAAFWGWLSPIHSGASWIESFSKIFVFIVPILAGWSMLNLVFTFLAKKSFDRWDRRSDRMAMAIAGIFILAIGYLFLGRNIMFLIYPLAVLYFVSVFEAYRKIYKQNDLY